MSGPGRRRNATGAGPIRDFTTIGEVTDPAFVRLPTPGTLFAARSTRFAAVADGNPLSAYLVFLSRLAAVQHAAQDLPPPISPLQPASQPPLNTGAPLSPATLARATLSGDGNFAQLLEWFIQHAVIADAPEAAAQAHARLAALPWLDRLALAQAILDGAYPVDQLAECLYVAAALQVHLARLAAQLSPAGLQPVSNGGCPACGGAPVASMIVGWAKADRARYCCCALCSTMWNHVRIKCTACDSTAGISYYLIEDQSKDIAVETCTTCRTYIKHLHQHRKPDIEPFADDIASYGLDMLIQQQDFRRATPNPFMVMV